MNGAIDVQRLPGGGTLFRLTIRLGYCAVHSPTATSSKLAASKILYVDGAELNRRLLLNQLVSWGLSATVTADARSAIADLVDATQQGQPFSLILIRHDSKALDAYALGREIRRRAGASATKILILAAEEKAFNTSETIKSSFDLSLTFPIHATDLLHALSHLVTSFHEFAPTANIVAPHFHTKTKSNPILNILLVEDNQVNQRVVLAMLKKWGHRIDIAWNGLEAIQAVQRQDYDLVLMDIQMPEMDGLTATQAIRELNDTRTSVPIVAITANTMQGDRERFLAAGMDDYLAKPIDRDALEAIIHRHTPLDQAPQTKTPEANNEPENDSPLLGDEVLTYLLNKLSGETVLELIDEYLTHSTSLLSQALVASEKQDKKSIEYAVHTLKGMSGALGALRMVDICQHILETCRNKDMNDIGPHMTGLSGTTEETQQALQVWRFKHEADI